MENILPKNLSEEEEEERTRILRLRASKQKILEPFPPEVRSSVTKMIEELVCELLFEFHMELHINPDSSNLYSRRSRTPDESLICMAAKLNITKTNQNIDCPNCSASVKCQWFSRHLAACMNPQQTISCRNSSRIARQRIQEASKSSNDSRIAIGDVQVRSNRRSNKSRKLKEENC